METQLLLKLFSTKEQEDKTSFMSQSILMFKSWPDFLWKVYSAVQCLIHNQQSALWAESRNQDSSYQEEDSATIKLYWCNMCDKLNILAKRS